jgi:hypothetical protein
MHIKRRKGELKRNVKVLIYIRRRTEGIAGFVCSPAVVEASVLGAT